MGSIDIDEDGFLQLSGSVDGSSATIEQGVKQEPERACDNGNNHMEICFKYRSKKGNGFNVIWDKKKVDTLIEFSDIWTVKCLRVPALTAHKFYLIGFQVEGQTSVNIDNVEVSCHTHSMYMNDVSNKPISTCGDGIHALNKLLG